MKNMRRLLRRLWPALLALAALEGLAAQSPDPWPRRIKDAGGHELVLARPPQAIVSLTLASDEVLFSLVDRKRLKGITFLAGDPGISNVAAAAKDFPVKLQGEKERIVALQPDLVLVADWKEGEFVQSLRQAGVPVFVMRSPRSFADLWDSLRLFGRLTGEDARAGALVDDCRRRLRAIAEREAGIPAERRRSILSYTLFGSTYGGDTCFNAIAGAAGLRNAAAGLKGWPQLSKEQILAMDPDLILLPMWSYGGKTDPAQFRRAFVGDPLFASLKAVKGGRVISISDAHFMNNSQYMVDGAEDLAKAAYPELFR